MLPSEPPSSDLCIALTAKPSLHSSIDRNPARKLVEVVEKPSVVNVCPSLSSLKGPPARAAYKTSPRYAKTASSLIHLSHLKQQKTFWAQSLERQYHWCTYMVVSPEYLVFQEGKTEFSLSKCNSAESLGRLCKDFCLILLFGLCS